ncbi:hypothetical protein HQO81_19330 [Rhodococcus fascians]|nr:hypothetical protein [Rhodococcus fascians]
MQDGTSKLEEQLNKNAPEDGEEKHVEELKTEIKSLAELMTKLGEQFTALDTKVETMNSEVTDLKSAVAELKPVEKPAIEDDTNTPAKGGEIDQPVAGDDEFDEDAELTDEMKAQIHAEFAEAAPSQD